MMDSFANSRSCMCCVLYAHMVTACAPSNILKVALCHTKMRFDVTQLQVTKKQIPIKYHDMTFEQCDSLNELLQLLTGHSWVTHLRSAHTCAKLDKDQLMLVS